MSPALVLTPPPTVHRTKPRLTLFRCHRRSARLGPHRHLHSRMCPSALVGGTAGQANPVVVPLAREARVQPAPAKLEPVDVPPPMVGVTLARETATFSIPAHATPGLAAGSDCPRQRTAPASHSAAARRRSAACPGGKSRCASAPGTGSAARTEGGARERHKSRPADRTRSGHHQPHGAAGRVNKILFESDACGRPGDFVTARNRPLTGLAS